MLSTKHLETKYMVQSIQVERMVGRSRSLQAYSSDIEIKLNRIGWDLLKLLAQIERLEEWLGETKRSV